MGDISTVAVQLLIAARLRTLPTGSASRRNCPHATQASGSFGGGHRLWFASVL